MTLSTSTISSADLKDSLELVEIKPGKRFSLATLKAMLPEKKSEKVETLLFLAKLYDLTAQQTGSLLLRVLNTDLARALFGEGWAHSNELQDYILDLCEQIPGYELGSVTFEPDVPAGEILPEVWESLEVDIAASIKEVAERLESVVDRLPGKEGAMVMSSMMALNKQRPVIGDYRSRIQHQRVQENLLIFDVSGSMNSNTVRRIVDDVVALSYKANAHMAIVSNQCFYWTPGSYAVDDVLAKAEYGGTHYEKLVPLFDRDWGAVITVADYDSSPAAMGALAQCTGRIDTVLDISLVGRPTFLAKCVGQLANEVRPLLTGNSDWVLT